MRLPGKGVEHAADGDAGEDAVVAPEASVDHLKGRGQCQGCGTRCGAFGWFWATVQRPPRGQCWDSGWPHSGHFPHGPSLSIRGASTNGVWSQETNNGKREWFLSCFPKISHRGASGVRGGRGAGPPGSPLSFSQSGCVFSKQGFN